MENVWINLNWPTIKALSANRFDCTVWRNAHRLSRSWKLELKEFALGLENLQVRHVTARASQSQSVGYGYSRVAQHIGGWDKLISSLNRRATTDWVNCGLIMRCVIVIYHCLRFVRALLVDSAAWCGLAEQGEDDWVRKREGKEVIGRPPDDKRS